MLELALKIIVNQNELKIERSKEKKMRHTETEIEHVRKYERRRKKMSRKYIIYHFSKNTGKQNLVSNLEIMAGKNSGRETRIMHHL